MKLNFKQFLENENQKIVYITRGLPGSGKSTLAQQLAGEKGVIFGDDDYFMKDGKYEWDLKKMPFAVQHTLNRLEEALKKGISPIIVDNTHVRNWEPQKSVKLALKYGYKVEIKEPNTPWKFDLETLAQKNRHGVTLERLQQMYKRWVPNLTVDKILKADHPKQEDIIV